MNPELPRANERTCSSGALRYWAQITPRQLGYMNEAKAAPFHLGGGKEGRYTEREAFAVMFLAACRRRGLLFRDIKKSLEFMFRRPESDLAKYSWLVIVAYPNHQNNGHTPSKPLKLFLTEAEVIAALVDAGRPGYVIDLADIRRRVAIAMGETIHKTQKPPQGSDPHGGFGR